jgi:hypothetical protein
MTRNVDDLHSFETRFLRAKQRVEKIDTSHRNKDLINKFIINCRREGLKKAAAIATDPKINDIYL